MKRLIIMFLLISTFFINGEKLGDIPDDKVILTVGKMNLTAGEFKTYIAGYSSVTQWTPEMLDRMVKAIAMDMLFTNACSDENISVSSKEVIYFAEYYFYKLGIDINDADKVQAYFDNSDPYLDMNDLLMKGTYYLLKTKYLAYKGLISSYRCSHVYFDTSKLSKTDIQKKKDKSTQIVYSIADAKEPFTSIFKKYSEDANTKNSLGDIGEVSKDVNNKYIPAAKDVERVLKSGIFTPIFVENKTGFSIVIPTTYRAPDAEKVKSLVEKLSAKYQIKQFINF